MNQPASKALTAASLSDRIGTDRLMLRPPQPADAADLVAGIGNFNVARMLIRVPHPYGEADARSWLAVTEDRWRSGLAFAYLIEHEGTVAGGIEIDGASSRPQLGYWLAAPYWGRGLASEAVRALIDACFTGLSVERLYSSVFADNPASWRVQEKLGFTISHRDRTHCLARQSEVEHIHTVLPRDRFDRLMS